MSEIDSHFVIQRFIFFVSGLVLLLRPVILQQIAWLFANLLEGLLKATWKLFGFVLLYSVISLKSSHHLHNQSNTKTEDSHHKVTLMFPRLAALSAACVFGNVCCKFSTGTV